MPACLEYSDQFLRNFSPQFCPPNEWGGGVFPTLSHHPTHPLHFYTNKSLFSHTLISILHPVTPFPFHRSQVSLLEVAAISTSHAGRGLYHLLSDRAPTSHPEGLRFKPRHCVGLEKKTCLTSWKAIASQCLTRQRSKLYKEPWHPRERAL